ncbi:MAG: ABC transporter permease subunit [Dehalococcoidia bacterium]
MRRALLVVNLRRGLYTNLAWAGALVLYAAAIAAVFPSVAETVAWSDYIEALPEELRQMAGLADTELALTAEGFFTFEGFLGTEYMAWWPVFMGVYAVIVGGGLVAKEAERGTLDILLSHPIRRSDLLLTKAVTQILVFAVLAGVSALAIVVFGLLLDEPVAATRVVAAHGMAFGLVVAIFGYSVFFSAAFLKSGRAMGAAGILTLVFYVLNVLGPSLGSLDWMVKLSLFNYFEGLRLLSGGAVNIAGVVIYAVIAVVSLGVSALTFERRDIVT